MRLACVLLGLFCVVIPFVFVPSRAHAEVLPDGAVRQAYYYQLQPPSKGTPPWHWRLRRGTLPPGIALERTGVLAGAPLAPGEFHFTLEATDSTPKPVVQTGDYVITVPSPLALRWVRPPYLTAQGAIEGEIEVSNGTGRTVDLTAIVVAINTTNKAFALGYQHVSLGPGGLRIPFGSALPSDAYVVHADAVVEIAETGEIYRARLQTDPLTVP